MFAATGKKMWDFYKAGNTITHQEINLLILGNVVAFVVALIAIKGFIDYLTKHGFKIFVWYRIVIGLIIIVMLLSEHKLSII